MESVEQSATDFVWSVEFFFVKLGDRSNIEGVHHIGKKDSAKPFSSAWKKNERSCFKFTWCSAEPDVSPHMMSNQR